MIHTGLQQVIIILLFFVVCTSSQRFTRVYTVFFDFFFEMIPYLLRYFALHDLSSLLNTFQAIPKAWQVPTLPNNTVKHLKLSITTNYPRDQIELDPKAIGILTEKGGILHRIWENLENSQWASTLSSQRCDLKLKQVVKGEMQVVSRMRDLPEAGMINGAIIRPIYFWRRL